MIFDGSRLELNYSTSAAGSVRIEVQDAAARPLSGFSLGDSTDLTGDEIERDYAWRSGPDVSSLKGTPVRLRIVLKDADLYAFRFRG